MEEIDTTAAAPEADSVRADIERALAEVAPAPGAPVTEAAKSDVPVTPEAKPDRARDDQGRFAKTDEAAAVAVAKQDVAKPAQEAAAEVAKPVAPLAGPPMSWPVAAKAAFATLPQAVQEAIAKRETEVSDGFKMFEGLRPYVEAAKQNGTTLQTAVSEYLKAEQALMSDFTGGVVHLCQRFGKSPRELATELMGGQRAPQAQPQPGQQPPVDTAAWREIQALKAQVQQFVSAQESGRQTALEREIEAFANEPANVWFGNVERQMASLIQNGQASTLKDAYEQAIWLNPETRAELVKQQVQREADTARQQAETARKASGSLPTGIPIPGARPNGAAPETVRGSILAALEAQGVRV